jgi:hypothetical protein
MLCQHVHLGGDARVRCLDHNVVRGRHVPVGVLLRLRELDQTGMGGICDLGMGIRAGKQRVAVQDLERAYHRSQYRSECRRVATFHQVREHKSPAQRCTQLIATVARKPQIQLALLMSVHGL